MPAKRRLVRDDWVSAALDAIGERGVDALSVEGVAERLGATKGSFYWHFADRADLVGAALARWRADETVEVIAEIESLPPGERLTALLSYSIRGPGAAVTLGILRAAREPAAHEVAADVHRTRIAYLGDLIVAQGMPQELARARARIAYAAFLGHLVLVGPAHDGERTSSLDELQAELEGMLTAPPRGA